MRNNDIVKIKRDIKNENKDDGIVMSCNKIDSNPQIVTINDRDSFHQWLLKEKQMAIATQPDQIGSKYACTQ